ncbi:DUF983 domain-containing protein [Sphingomonas limnosediminicola]|uniref:DUF983 domain-containing protein n=1 Tax=Sphingomonas limnosediminicola TaxID=940133 RepID=A0ABP7LLM1_9SPHN
MKAPVSEPSSLKAALAGDCPRCGSRTLFAGWVTFAKTCRNCGLDLDSFNVGDGPAAFLIFIVGAITVVGALVVDGAFSPPWWVHLVWIPVATALTVGGLRFSKAWLLAQEYRHRAREGRIAE